MKPASIRHLLRAFAALCVALLLLVSSASADPPPRHAHDTRTAKTHVKSKSKDGKKRGGSRQANKPKHGRGLSHAKGRSKSAATQPAGEEAGEAEAEEAEEAEELEEASEQEES